MTLEEFESLFRQALMEARSLHPKGSEISENSIIELHYSAGGDLTISDAANAMWLGENSFHRCIDVAVHPKRSNAYFVRVAGFEPGDWSSTYHPDTSGPFHILGPS